MTTATDTEHEQALDAQLRRLFSNTPTALEVQKETFTDEFEMMEFLGEGREGKVYRVRKGTKTYIAKKVTCNIDSTERRDVEKQIQALERLAHPNIPSYVDCLVEDHLSFRERTYFLLTEDVRGETLMEYHRRKGVIPNQELEDICNQTLDALAHAHSNGVLHRDIKPENLLITEDGQVQLIDWGVAKIEGAKTRLSTVGVVGTAGYMAPEVFNGEKGTNKSDIYSLGATLIAAARGEDNQGFDSTQEMKLYLKELDRLEEFKEGLESMIEEDPDDRRWELVDGKYCFEREVKDSKKRPSGKEIMGWCGGISLVIGLSLPYFFPDIDSLPWLVATVGPGTMLGAAAAHARLALSGWKQDRKQTKKLQQQQREQQEEMSEEKKSRRQLAELSSQNERWYDGIKDVKIDDEEEYSAGTQIRYFLGQINKYFREEDLEYIIPALDHEEPAVRVLATYLLEKDKQGVSSAKVAWMTRFDPNDNVRRHALKTLTEMDYVDPQAINDHVRDHIGNGDIDVRRWTVKIIGKTRDPQYAALLGEPLQRCLASPSKQEAKMGIPLLGAISQLPLTDLDVRRYVLPFVDSGNQVDPKFKAAAIRALDKLDYDRQYSSTIEKIAQYDGNQGIREAAWDYLRNSSTSDETEFTGPE